MTLNEILADNSIIEHDGTYPDYIELVNHGTAPYPLAGLTLSDDADVATPPQFTFPSDTPPLAAGARLVLWCDNTTPASSTNTGFNISAAGETLELRNGTTLIDSGIDKFNDHHWRAGRPQRWRMHAHQCCALHVGQRCGSRVRQTRKMRFRLRGIQQHAGKKTTNRPAKATLNTVFCFIEHS